MKRNKSNTKQNTGPRMSQRFDVRFEWCGGDDSSTAVLCKGNQPAPTMHSWENCGGYKQKPLVPYYKSNGDFFPPYTVKTN